ncbi:hypothetical protein Mapa_003940 [Marchantia paleacea]|nr:hypothetical protein Mapa_003940 [Marchantia paleacea]
MSKYVRDVTDESQEGIDPGKRLKLRSRIWRLGFRGTVPTCAPLSSRLCDKST